MLEHLSVTNFAIIEYVELSLKGGMTIFSGETGAGKSLIVDALGFLLGARADSSIIREGAKECSVSAVFSYNPYEDLQKWLAKNEIECDQDEGILIRRTLKDNGRSLAWIQERQVSRNELLDFTQYLVDIHGQHEHQRLIDPATHISMLDAFAELSAELQQFQSEYNDWRRLAHDYAELLEQKAKRAQEIDYLEFVIKDIASIKPKASEDEQLEAEEKILSQHEKLYAAISEASGVLDGSDNANVVHWLKRVRADLESARSIDARIASLSDRVSAVYYEIEDISESLKEYQSGLRFDPIRLESIEHRLADLQRLKRKYGPQLFDVLARYERARVSVETYSHADESAIELESRLKQIKASVLEKAIRISERRMASAAAFGSAIEEIVRKLGMPEAQVHLRVTRSIDDRGAYRISLKGIDQVEFFIAPNPGESEQPLSRIASGGELSRLALALKAVLASRDAVETLVFDEIDAGIGGQVGVAVGGYLRQLSEFRQVLCVTHLATIAAQADHQGKVEKVIENGRTSTQIHFLTRSEREEEIARMLSGTSESEVSRVHAAELLDKNTPRGR